MKSLPEEATKESVLLGKMDAQMELFNQIRMKPPKMSEEKLNALKRRLAELNKFKDATTEELGKKSEIVMAREHICNNNLKIDGTKADKYMIWKHPDPKVKKEFQIRTFQDVIDFHQSCLVSLTDVNGRNQESESARAKRLAENEANLEQIRIRAARREYDKSVSSIAGFDNKSSLKKREEMADFRFMMAFGVGFITIMFLGFLTGFCIGKFVLAWEETESLYLSLITGIPTLFVEAFLMIIRLHKWEKKRDAERNQLQSRKL